MIIVVHFVFYLFSGRLNELTKISLKNFSLFAASGIMACLIAVWKYFYLLEEGMTSKIVAIADPLSITAVLGVIILVEEQATMRRILGIILTIIGIILAKQ